MSPWDISASADKKENLVTYTSELGGGHAREASMPDRQTRHTEQKDEAQDRDMGE
jgi:hypothetical protein